VEYTVPIKLSIDPSPQKYKENSMSNYPSRPVGTRKSGVLFAVLFPIILVGVLVYNLMPNLISAIFPSHNKLSGQWVGLAQVSNPFHSNSKQLAAIKLVMHPTSTFNVVPQWKIVGEMTMEGQTTPITFEADQVIGGHSEDSHLSGMLSHISLENMSNTVLSGELKNDKLHLELMGGDAEQITGDLKHGDDAAYQEACKQIH
jgi:hypothetical protein